MRHLDVRNLVSVLALGAVAVGPSACASPDFSPCVESVPVYDPGDPYAERCVKTEKQQREEIEAYLESNVEESNTVRFSERQLRGFLEMAADAAASGNLEELELLIGNEDWYAQALFYLEEPTTPMHAAASNGRGDVVAYLIDNDSPLLNLNRRDGLGMTALHHAALQGHAEALDRLLDAGASVDVADRQGETPLHEAAKGGHLVVVERLVDSGADPGSRTDEGKTPLALAREAGHSEVVEWLNNRGGH